jgi:hypothetical protein
MTSGCRQVGKWRVQRTHEEQPCEQYVVVRTLAGGTIQTYQYADTREEALALRAEAERSGVATAREVQAAREVQS